MRNTGRKKRTGDAKIPKCEYGTYQCRRQCRFLYAKMRNTAPIIAAPRLVVAVHRAMLRRSGFLITTSIPVRSSPQKLLDSAEGIRQLRVYGWPQARQLKR